MAGLTFHIEAWLGTFLDDLLERETIASLRIAAGADGIPLTEVEDTMAHTVRRHINVPAYSLARWLLVNWWRLRWEPYRVNPSYDWLSSHCMGAIGGDYAWPALTFSSDGEFIQLRLQSETSADACALRYLRDVTVDVAAADFEQAVDSFVDDVEARIAVRAPAERELAELREELREEQRDAGQSIVCKLQALAGLDPGSAPNGWMVAAQALVTQVGAFATAEILAVTPALEGGLGSANAAVSAMRDSATTVKLDWGAVKPTPAPANEIPWERGARLAREFRARQGIPPGPLAKNTLEQLLDASLPLPLSPWKGQRQLRGGYRNGRTDGRAALLVTSQREDSQRFYLGRLVAAALVSAVDQHVLPVSDAATALQKLERSFAQELLCPWQDLDAFTDHSGTDDDGIAEAAEHFIVSERLVLSTLVDKGKIPRSRLQP